MTDFNTSADVSSFVDSLNLDDELIGSTVGDDGIDLLAGTSAPADTTTAPAAEVIATAPVAGESKAAHARRIFNLHYGKKSRKDILALFVSEAKCTEKGAATYYQNETAKLKKAAELAATVATTETDSTEE